jgi:hypothetical protein
MFPLNLLQIIVVFIPIAAKVVFLIHKDTVTHAFGLLSDLISTLVSVFVWVLLLKTNVLEAFSNFRSDSRFLLTHLQYE